MVSIPCSRRIITATIIVVTVMSLSFGGSWILTGPETATGAEWRAGNLAEQHEDVENSANDQQVQSGPGDSVVIDEWGTDQNIRRFGIRDELGSDNRKRISSIQPTSQQEGGDLTIDVRHSNGGQADEVNALVIYQDDQSEVYEKVEIYPGVDLEQTFSNLPAGHDYLVEAYIHDQFAGATGWISIESGESKSRTIDADDPIYVEPIVYYDDGSTPLPGATVTVESHEGYQWRKAMTRSDGHTDPDQLWLYPPNKGKYTVSVEYDGQIVAEKELDPSNFNSPRSVELVSTVSVPENDLSVAVESGGTVQINPPGISTEGTTETYEQGTEVELTASASSGTRFDGWKGDVTSDSRSLTVTMDEAKDITATFQQETSEPDTETNPNTDTANTEGSESEGENNPSQSEDDTSSGSGESISKPFTENFENDRDGWKLDLHPDANNRVTEGEGEWTSEHGGSVHLSVDGGPDHIGIYRPVNGLTEGTEVRVEYDSPNLAGEPGSPRIILHLPNQDENILLDRDRGRGDDQDGVLTGTIPRDLPDGTELEVRLGVWPGKIDVYVTSISVEEPSEQEELVSGDDSAGNDLDEETPTEPISDGDDEGVDQGSGETETDEGQNTTKDDSEDGIVVDPHSDENVANGTERSDGDADSSRTDESSNTDSERGEDSGDQDSTSNSEDGSASDSDGDREETPEVTVERQDCVISGGQYYQRYRVAVSPSGYDYRVMAIVKDAETGEILEEKPDAEVNNGGINFVETPDRQYEPSVIDLVLFDEENGGVIKRLEASEECAEMAIEHHQNNRNSGDSGENDDNSDSRDGSTQVEQGPEVDQEFDEAARETALENKDFYRVARTESMNPQHWSDRASDRAESSLETFKPTYEDAAVTVLEEAAGTSVGSVTISSIEVGANVLASMQLHAVSNSLEETNANEELQEQLRELEANTEKLENKEDVNDDGQFTAADKEIIYQNRKEILEETYEKVTWVEAGLHATLSAPATTEEKTRDQNAYGTIRGRLEMIRKAVQADYQTTTSWLQNKPSETTLPEAVGQELPHREFNAYDKRHVDTLDTVDDYALYRITIPEEKAGGGRKLFIRTEDIGRTPNFKLYLSKENRIEPENPAMDVPGQVDRPFYRRDTKALHYTDEGGLKAGETYYVLVEAENATSYQIRASATWWWKARSTDIEMELVDSHSYSEIPTNLHSRYHRIS